MKFKNLFDPAAFTKAIEESPYSRNEIAKMVGCHTPDISRYEAGKTVPRKDRLLKLVRILGPSITGLSVVANRDTSMKRFTPEERRFLSWFRSLPYFRQAKVSGYCDAIVEFGNYVDADFAGDLSEILAREVHTQKGQSEQPEAL